MSLLSFMAYPHVRVVGEVYQELILEHFPELIQNLILELLQNSFQNLNFWRGGMCPCALTPPPPLAGLSVLDLTLSFCKFRA